MKSDLTINSALGRVLSSGLALLALITLLIGFIATFTILRLPYDGLKWKTSNGEVTQIYKSGPAQEAGIRLGDLVTQIDGIDLDQARPIYGSKQASDTTRLTLSRNGELRQVQLKLAAAPWPVFTSRLTYLILAAAFWLLGLLPFWQRKSDPITQSFLLLCIWGATALWVIQLAFWRFEWAHRLMYASVPLSGASFLHFHLLFPYQRNRKHWKWLCQSGYLIAITLALLFLLYGSLGVKARAYALGIPGNLPALLVQLMFMLTILVGLLLLLSAHRSALGHTRRQVRLVVFGTLIGFSPLIPYGISNMLELSIISSDLAMMSLIVVPTVYMISINRSDLMKIDSLLYRVLVYLLVALLLLASYLGVWSLIAMISPRIAQMPVTGALVSLLVAVSLSPAQRLAQKSLYQLFYGSSYDYSEVLSDSWRTLVETPNSQRLVEVLTSRVTKEIGTKNAGLWINQKEEFVWLGGSTETPGALKLPSEVMSRLQAGKVVHQPLSAAAEFPKLNFTARWWVPLVLFGELLGVWAVGAKVNDDSFSQTDDRLIRAIACQAALILKVTRLVEQLRDQLAKSESYRQELSQAYEVLVQTREDERARLARDLHDEVIQAFHGIRIGLQLLPDKKVQKEQLQIIIGDIQQAIVYARRLCQGLRPVALESGLIGGIQSLIREITQPAQITVTMSVSPGDPCFNKEIEITLYRIVQEALNNIVKHAQAKQAEIQVNVQDNRIMLFVQDDGIGFDCAKIEGKRFGLIGIRERVVALGGKLTIESAPGEGTAIWVQIRRNKERHIATT